MVVFFVLLSVFIFKVMLAGCVRYPHNLDLSDCRGITDVSALGNVHTFTLSGCENITDTGISVPTLNDVNVNHCDRDPWLTRGGGPLAARRRI